jgi:hypothetical protein
MVVILLEAVLSKLKDIKSPIANGILILPIGNKTSVVPSSPTENIGYPFWYILKSCTKPVRELKAKV